MRIGRAKSGQRWLAALLVLLTVAAAALPAAAKGKGDHGKVTPQIVRGHKVPDGQNLFMAALLRYDPSATEQKSPYQRQFCGGSVIGPRAILTAAHCLYGNDAAKVQVLVGRNNLDGSGGVVINALALHVNPSYDPRQTSDDAAVVVLASAIPAEYYHPIALVGSGDTQYEAAGDAVTVSGWGSLHQKGDYPKDLYEVGVRVYADSVCAAQKSYGRSFLPASMICAGAKNPTRDSCFGDSGGPLFADTPNGPVEVGIVSWGHGCAQKKYPGVYTRLSNAEINDFVRSASVWQ